MNNQAWWRQFAQKEFFWLTLITSYSSLTIKLHPLQAQIIPDNTLGAENSFVNQIDATLQEIEGGAIRGNNLFHSFLEFSIGEGNAVYFANPAEVLNIFSRVTGNNLSQILGILGVLGDANLYLINPNGILFGPNAQLDITGSFIASSANSVMFANGAEFSATNPQAPPLLTVNTSTPVGLKLAGIPGVITSQAQLITAPRQTIALIGGEVNIEGGTFIAEEGRIELGSVSNNSQVNFTISDLGLLALDYSQANNFNDLSLSNTAYLDVSGERGGEIQLQAQNITLSGPSFIVSTTSGSENGGNITLNASGTLELSGIIEIDEGFLSSSILTQSFGQGKAGDIIINAEYLSIQELGVIVSTAYDVGNGGNIEINTKQITVIDGASINSSTVGNGKGGDININATESVELIGFFNDDINLYFSAIASQARGESGDSGNITINTPNLLIEDGAFIDSSTFGGGKAGNIFISADVIQLNASDNFTEIASQTANESLATGNAGNITIETQQLNLFGGAQISVASRNGSTAGDININASDSIIISGTTSNATLTSGQSGIFVSAEPANVDLGISAGGDTGNLIIETNNLLVEKGAKISADTFGLGKGGDVTLNVNQLQVLDGGLIRAASLLEDNAPTLERGDSGTLTINATESVIISGIALVGEDTVNSSLVTETQGIGGDAGLLTINTPHLSIYDQGVITASTSGQNANANRILIDNAQSVTLDNSFILSLVNEGAIGNSGEIIINTNNLTLDNSSLILTSTSGEGNAGEITINARDSVELKGNSDGFRSAIGSEITETGTGGGGKITIETATLTLDDGSFISANTYGIGNAGLIDITATNSINILGADSRGFISGIVSEVGEGGKGNSNGIKINTGVLTINDGGLISAGLSGEGNAGSINITATDSITIQGEDNQGFGGGIASEVESTGKGNSNEIKINTGNLTLINGGKISANTSGEGNAGVINITAEDSITISGEDSQGLISGIGSEVSQFAKGDSGGIIVNTANLIIEKGALISASTFSEGNAGKIDITATNSILLTGEDSQGIIGGIGSEVGEKAKGDSGGITINTATLTINEGALISASTRAEGNAGQIIINANDIEIKGKDTKGFGSGILSQVEKSAIGDSGGITINISSLSISDGGAISTVTSGKGNAGKIEIKADSVLLSGEDGNNLVSRFVSEVDETGIGNSNEINITTKSLELNQGAAISASTFGQGKAGNININATDSVSLSGTSFNADVNREVGGIFAITFTDSDAGNILINTPQLIISDGSGIEAFTSGNGDAGNININASDNILLESNTKLIVETNSGGIAGNININTPLLTIGENAQLSATATNTSTAETAGDINLNVNQLNISGELGIFAETQSIADAGSLTIQPYQNYGQDAHPTSLNLNIQFTDNGFISARTTSIGDGGSIIITAPETINIRGLGSITAETLGEGNAGNININTANLTIADSTNITTSTNSAGNAGLITLNADESIFLTNQAQITSEVKKGATGTSEGIIINTPLLSISDRSQISAATQDEGKAGDINLIIDKQIIINGENTGIFADTARLSSGKGGNIDVKTQELLIENGGVISVNSLGSGEGGSITISTENLTLNQGTISAQTTSGDGGDIDLRVNEFLTLRNNSQISTTAGNLQTGGNGGNIEIFARYIFAIPQENSDITANAFSGDGGQIFITTEAIFGIEPRAELTFLSDITASSESGVDGIIEITRLNVDPLEGLNNLPEIRDNVRIAQGCNVAGNGNISFYDIGKGGLPAKPDDYLSSDNLITPWLELERENNSKSWNLDEQKSVKILNLDSKINFSFSCI